MTVAEFIKTSNVVNDIVALHSQDKDDPHYMNTFWVGMEWQLMESNLASLPFKRLFAPIADSIPNSGRINIEVDSIGLTEDNTCVVEYRENHRVPEGACQYVHEE